MSKSMREFAKFLYNEVKEADSTNDHRSSSFDALSALNFENISEVSGGPFMPIGGLEPITELPSAKGIGTGLKKN